MKLQKHQFVIDASLFEAVSMKLAGEAVRHLAGCWVAPSCSYRVAHADAGLRMLHAVAWELRSPCEPLLAAAVQWSRAAEFPPAAKAVRK